MSARLEIKQNSDMVSVRVHVHRAVFRGLMVYIIYEYYIEYLNVILI